MEESGNAKERVTESDSARKGRIDLTQFEGMSNDWEVVPQPDGEYAIVTGRDNSSLKEAYTIAKLPNLIAELKKCYEIIDIYQSTGEDFNTQLAFHEKGLCEYLKHPCGPCEGEEGYYDDPLELSPELQAFYERGPSPRRTTEKQMEEAQRKREYGHSRPSVDDYDPVYDDPNYEASIDVIDDRHEDLEYVLEELQGFVGVPLPWYGDYEEPGVYTYDGTFVADEVAYNPFGDRTGYVLLERKTSRYVTLGYARTHHSTEIMIVEDTPCSAKKPYKEE